MMYAKICPKCKGKIQTKVIKKSIGLGFIDIPVAQFCINPKCDWYQDFSESVKTEEVEEGVFHIKIPSFKNRLPEIKKPPIPLKPVVAGGILLIAIIFILINSMSSAPQFQIPEPNLSRPLETPQLDQPVISTPVVPLPTQTPDLQAIQIPQKSPIIKVDVAHGFFPDAVTITKSDTVLWINEENQRTRIILISKDGLFKDQLMHYTGYRFSYQFNRSGKYTFTIGEYNPKNEYTNEYPNATGYVIVQ